MFKRTWNSPHFIARTASHSTKGKRNGRVDVLPPGASESLYGIAEQIADGEQRLARLRAERDELADELHRLQRVEAFKAKHVTSPKSEPRVAILLKGLRELDASMASVRKRNGELKSLLGGRGAVSFEHAFVRVAREMLEPSSYRAIESQASALVAKTKERAK